MRGKQTIQSVSISLLKRYRRIAVIFKDYVKACVKSCRTSPALEFIPGIGTMSPSEIFTPDTVSLKSQANPAALVFKITTPQFYHQIACHPRPCEYLNTSLANSDPQKSTFHTSHPELLLQMFDNFQPHPTVTRSAAKPKSMDWRWRLLAKLRHDKRLSSLDIFTMTQYSDDDPTARVYRNAVMRLLLSERFAFGLPALLDGVLFFARVYLYWVCVRSINRLSWLDGRIYKAGVVDMVKFLLGCVGLHLWAALGSLV